MSLRKSLLALVLLLSFKGYSQVKLVLNSGQKIEVTTDLSTTSVASVMGQDIESSAATNTTEVFEVKNASSKQTEMVATVTHLTADIVAMGQQTKYDSDKKDNTDPGASEMGDMVNKPKNITIDQNGKVLKEDKTATSAATQFAGSALSSTPFLRETFVGKDLKVGDSWMDSTTNTGDKLTTNTVGTYTVKTIDNNIATISFTGTTKLSGSMEQMGQEMEMTSTSTVTAETKLDITTGIIIESVANSDGNMSIEAAGMSIPVTVKTKTTTKSKML